jgi:hypothetical protein
MREIKFYDEVLPLYTNFQREKGIDIENEGFYEVAKCLKTMSEEPHEGMFFEDLKTQDFDMYDRFKELTAEHVNLVMKALGKFHAIFFALKDQRPQSVEFSHELNDLMLYFVEMGKPLLDSWYQPQLRQVFKALKSCKNEKMKQRAEDILNAKLFDILKETVTSEAAEPYAAICHGDVSCKLIKN